MRWPVAPKPRAGDTTTRRRFVLLPEQVGAEWVWWEWVVDAYVKEVRDIHPVWPYGNSEQVSEWRHVSTSVEQPR